ncbi:MAG: ATP-binding protein [Oscillospiraceae bacterium]|jgi:hypothetical protein|nr:ATP-binding protein [Oscillospiraceae bacterium]
MGSDMIAIADPADSAGVEFITDFWREQYLEPYISQGGSKIKFITGSPGSGKSHCLRLFMSDAESLGCKAVALSAKSVWLNDFKEIYAAVLGAVDFKGCLENCARKVVSEMGGDFGEIPDGASFADYLADKGMLDPVTRLELRAQINSMFFKNPRMDKNFAVCAAMLTGGILGHPVLEQSSNELLWAWLRAEKGVRTPAIRKLGLAPYKISKHNARHMLRSLIEVVRLAGYPALVVGIDDLEILTGNSSLEEIRYTKMRREDAYESIRELIDGIDTLSNVMFVFSFGKELLDDESCGFKSYQALWMRIQNEIAGGRFNRFADIIDMDRLNSTKRSGECI